MLSEFSETPDNSVKCEESKILEDFITFHVEKLEIGGIPMV